MECYEHARACRERARAPRAPKKIHKPSIAIRILFYNDQVVECSIASIAVSQNFILQVENGQYGCNRTVGLNIDGRSREIFHANVDMIEIFYCLYVVFIISRYVQ